MIYIRLTESYHLGFVSDYSYSEILSLSLFFLLSDLHLSSGNLSLSLFLLSDLHPIKESYHLDFVSDLHLSSRILSLSLFLLSDLHPIKESYHLGFISDLHPF